MLRGKDISQWRRSALAVAVASLATLGVTRLIVLPGPDNLKQSQLADVDSQVAGRIDSDWVDQPTQVSPAPEPIMIALTLDQTRRAEAYLQDAGLDPNNAAHWASILAKQGETRTFVKGHELTLYRDPETGELRGLRYNIDERIAISQETYGDGVMRLNEEPIEYVLRPVAISFQLHHDFWRDAKGHQVPRSILDTLDYAFHDYHPLDSLPRGSDVKLIYQEKVSHDGTTHFATGLEAASISYSGKTLTAIAFRDENGAPHLYNSNGVALGVESLRFPLKFDYISSGFTYHRYHPILHVYRPHLGVDFAARYGTPVRAVADGRVEEAGWCGEMGKCVRLQHQGGIITVYGHLSRVTIEKGQSVRVGELIGLVGATGLATGPHLHYGVEKDGKFVNPLMQTLGVHHEVSPRLRALFDSFKREYTAILERLPLGGRYSVALTATQALGNAVLTAAHPTTVGGPQVVSETPKTATYVTRAAVLAPISGRVSILR